MDDILDQMRTRFCNHKKIICGLSKLLSLNCIDCDYRDIEECVTFYLDDVAIREELELWKDSL